MRKHYLILFIISIIAVIGLLSSCSVPPSLDMTSGYYIKSDECFDYGNGYIDNWSDSIRDDSISSLEINSDGISISGYADSSWDDIDYYEDESIALIQYTFGSDTHKTVVDYNYEDHIAYLYLYDTEAESVEVVYGTYVRVE